MVRFFQSHLFQCSRRLLVRTTFSRSIVKSRCFEECNTLLKGFNKATVLTQQYRLLSNEDQREPQMNSLMNSPPVVWPNIIHTIKNWFFAHIIIQQYFDREFSLKNFAAGAKQALETISAHISAGRFDLLEGLVTSEALQEIQGNYVNFDVDHRMALKIASDDIFFTFPYQIGIILNENTKQRFAEILVVYHCMKDYKNLMTSQPEIEDYKKRITVCNYRFIREYTKGVESDWTVNHLNHFKATDFY